MKSILTGLILYCISLYAQITGDNFLDSFNTDNCTFSSTGQNKYFILVPGYRLTLEGIEDGDTSRVVITVLNETKKINGIETRIVEENESENGETIEISRNFFAICSETGNVFYFGEEVDIFKKGKIVSHSGAWIAEGSNKPGIIMLANPENGYRYYQEIAPGIAMDRAEIISLNETYETPAGKFTGCLKTKESSSLNPEEKEYKHYAPGIGLIQDEHLLLIKYEYIK